MTILTGGRIITPDAVLDSHELLIDGGEIVEIRETAPASVPADTQTADIVHLGGAYVAPGFIDLHSDYIEHMAAPRPTTLMDFSLALRVAEREMLTHGITTMYHSLALYSFSEFGGSAPIRSPENTRALAMAIDKTRKGRHLIRHRFHARFEIDNIKRTEEVAGYIAEGKVHLVSFMDHTPGQGQYRDLEIYRKTLKGYRNLSDEQVDTIIELSRGREKLTLKTMAEIAELARGAGIAVASHDDDGLAKLELMKEVGAGISEFPTTVEVALEARRRGMHTVAGAPNVLLGGSHSGNLSAREAILAGGVDVLCSDYYPPALLHAVFALADRGDLSLPAAMRLVTLNPALAVGLEDDFGSIEAGKRADLICVEQLEDGFPVVSGAYIDGREVLCVRHHY